MSPKVKAAAKPASKKVEKVAKPAKAAKPGKAAKASKEEPAPVAAAPGEGDEDMEDAEDGAAASGGGGNAAALAAASGQTEMSTSFKNFRHHPDMENFYRFIYENDLRHEALTIIDQIMTEKKARKLQGGKGTKSAH